MPGSIQITTGTAHSAAGTVSGLTNLAVLETFFLPGHLENLS